MVSFKAAPDFEAPGDDGGDNVYDIIVTASDDTNSTNQNVAITVTNENDNIPAFTSPATANTRENQTAAYMASATDADGDTLVYSLSGTDAALFTIDADTGVVSFRAAPDFEAPGDADGDNVYDIIVTASDGANSTEQPVAITVTDEYDLIPLSSLDGSNGFALTGIDTRDYSGTSVSSAGDVNGDGYDDLIIGAREADPNEDSNAGETYVVYGGASAPGGVLDLSSLNGTNGFILTGIDRGDSSGISVSSAGDVNGDGYDDLIIGAHRADPNGDSQAGETYVVYGGASAPSRDGMLDLSSLNGTNGFILTGIDARDYSGFSVSSAGDINGDGYDDLIIGAFRAAPNGNDNAGETYIVYGGASAPGTGGMLDLSALDGSNGFTLTGIDAFDYSGRSVSSAGDVNGDGYDDLIIGARGAGFGGETYIVYGGATGTESLVPVTAQGMAAADNFTGNAGDDNFTAIATNDVVRGGAGNDTIRVTSLDFAAIDGGTGADTLVLDGAGLALDLTGAGHAGVDSVELFDLSGTGANTLALDALAVFDVTEEREGGGMASLDVRGDADDRVELSGSNFARTGTATEDGVTYNVYRDGNAQLRIENGVQVQIPPVVFTSPAAVSVAEGQSAAYEAAATDADGDTLVYSLSGTDAALFTIDANTGEVSFIAAPDFEMPGDADGDNVYNITVTAFDGTNRTDRDVAITVTNENDNIPVFTSPAAVSAQENRMTAYEAAATDADGDPLIYSLSGTDAALFTIGSTTGEVRFRVAPDFEVPGDADGDNVYDINVTASDGTNRTDHNVAITVTNENDNIPVFTSPAAVSAQENRRTAYEAAATDADGDPLVYRLSGTDAALFRIGSTTGEVRFRVAPDFEDPDDADGDNVYDIIVTASDGTNRTDHNVAITVTDEENDPVDLSRLDGTNGFTLTGIDAGDQSGASVSSAGDVNGDGYDDLIIGARDADVYGRRNTGETYVVYGGASAPGTEGVLDLSGLDGSNGFILTGINRGDRSGFSVSSAGDVNGDGYDDLIIGANRADPNGDINAGEGGETYIVYGGASTPGEDGELNLGALDGTNGFILAGIDAGDRSGSSVSSAGDVNGDGYDDLIIGANRANPNGDSNAGETYVIYGGATGTESLTPVTASGTAAADNFTGNAGDDSFTAIATNDVVRGGAGNDMISVTALDFAAIDGGTGVDTLVLDGADLSLDLTGTGHASVDSVEIFDLSGTGANSLVLDALAVFDVTEEREGGAASLDVLGDADDRVDLSGSSFALTGTAEEDGVTYNIYRDGNAQLRVETGVQVVTVPGITSPAAVSVAENQTAAYEAAATDDEGDPLVYSLSGTDAALFTLNANTGEVSFIAAPDFEAPGDADGDNVYDITVTASDGTNSTNHNVAITVTNENDNIPVFTSPAAVSAQENQTAAYEAAATDADGDPLVYSLSGTDAALFTINADTGEVSFIAAPDFEAPGDDDRDNVYDITVTASDGTNRTDHNVAITVTDYNIPVFTSPFVVSVAENQTAAYRAAAADDEGDPLVYSLSGTDAALFMIDANTGEVSFMAAPDFEAPGDDDQDNVYDITVTASDGTNRTDHNVAIRVTDENDNIPVFTSPATANAQENQTAAYEAAATDADGDPLVYSLSGTDAALFTIGSTTGEVRFRVAPDFERPGDADGDNVYDITVTAFDGTDRTDHNVAITVTDEENDPINLSSLDGRNGFTLTGIDAGDQSGFSVSSARDVNGDGYDDLIIGAWRADPNGDSGAGETYVIYGGASAPGTEGVLDLGALDGTNGFILTGIDANDNSGFSVSSAGDVNGDGYNDLIIGARLADPNGDIEAGETYIVYGGASAPGTDGVLDLSALDGTNGFILNGIGIDEQSGRSVSSAGDVNGDGYDDLIIGAYRADSFTGKTYVVYGGASAPGTNGELDLSSLNGTNGFILTGIDRSDQSGRSVSSAGDVNGDGYDDLIIGARSADPNGGSNVGETYIVYGGANAPGTDGVLDLSALDGTNGFILNGIDEFDQSGSSVSSAGDVNGDGYDDLIIGAFRADPNGDSGAGETYIVYGGASAPGQGGRFNLSMLDGMNGFTLTGIDAGDNSGYSVSSAGDVNGDGYDDLIIGARFADPNGDSSGETYVVYGGANAPGTGGVLNLSDLDGTNGFIIAGIDVDDQSGSSVSSAGDVNGDGYDDLIIGARFADPNGGSEAGETYIVYGGATGTESLTPVTASGTAAADNFTGNAGDDSFTGIATDDVVRGGAGDDRISVTALDFAAIDGGTGQDTLILDGAGLALDLTGPGHAGVDSVELFDLSGTGANSLVLDALAVFGVTEERAGGVASLDVLGDADDRVDLSGSNFALTGTATEDGVTYNVYRDGNAEVRVEDGVTVTLAAAGAQSAESKTDIRIDPVADPRTDPGTGTIRLDGALMNPDPLMNNDLWNNNLWNNDLWDDLWADGVKSPDQPVHIDEDAILIPLSEPLSFGPLASGPLPGPWGDLMYWPGLESHPAMQNDLAMILPEMEIVTADMEGF